MRSRIRSTGMGYLWDWSDEDDNVIVTFEAEDIERTAWGLMSTLTVRTRIAGARTLSGGFVTHERVNLLNSRSRRDLASRIASLIPAPSGAASIDWERVSEQLALDIMAQEKRPLDVRDLSTVTPAREVPYLIPAIVPARKTTILYGAGGTGKSIVAAAIAAAVQTGTPFIGLGAQRAEVLYLDWETDEGDIANRLRLTAAGLGLRAVPSVRYVALVGPLEQHQSDIAALCTREGIGLVIIDSVGMATAGARDGGDLAEGAVKFFRMLRALNAACLAIDHISSDDLKARKGTSKPFGSVFKVNSARNTFELRDTTEMGGPHRLTLTHRKTNLGPRIDDISMTVDWQETYVRFARSTFVARMDPLDIRIHDALRTGPSTAKGLVDLLNEQPGYERVNEYEVRATLLDMKRDGALDIDHTGVARLPEEKPKAEPEEKQETLFEEET